MNPPHPDLSVIIVNWNSAGYARKCIESIRIHTSGPSYEIIVVDNASYDGIEKIVSAQFPLVRFVQLGENRGFAAANNAGVAAATGSTLCFLNPDTELTGNVFAAMLELLKNDARAGIAGCRLLNTDLSLQTSCVLPYPTIINQVFDIEWLKRRTPHWNLWGMSALFSPGGRSEEVEAVSGACMFVPRAVFEKIGGFCEDYFMYMEDIDLCYKVRLAGYTVVYNGGAEIIHHGGKSSGGAGESGFETVRTREAMTIYFTKHKSKRYSAAYKKIMFVAALVRLAAIAVSAPFVLLARRRKRIEGAARKWLRVAHWAGGFQTGRRPI